MLYIWWIQFGGVLLRLGGTITGALQNIIDTLEPTVKEETAAVREKAQRSATCHTEMEDSTRPAIFSSHRSI